MSAGAGRSVTAGPAGCHWPDAASVTSRWSEQKPGQGAAQLVTGLVGDAAQVQLPLTPDTSTNDLKDDLVIEEPAWRKTRVAWRSALGMDQSTKP